MKVSGHPKKAKPYSGYGLEPLQQPPPGEWVVVFGFFVLSTGRDPLVEKKKPAALGG